MKSPLLTRPCVTVSIHSTNAEVDLFNHNKLRDSGMPVKKFEPLTRDRESKQDQAENLLCRVMLYVDGEWLGQRLSWNSP
jgi:hypothetical protein